MKIFLNNNCESFTGRIGKNYGYAVQKQGKGFYLRRNSRGHVPPDGHIQAIFDCAEIAMQGTYFSDVECKAEELHNALYEARDFVAAQQVWENFVQYKKRIYHARDILNFKTTFSL